MVTNEGTERVAKNRKYCFEDIPNVEENVLSISEIWIRFDVSLA